jgi:hypothetical protein
MTQHKNLTEPDLHATKADSVGPTQLQTNAVETQHILNGQVSPAKLDRVYSQATDISGAINTHKADDVHTQPQKPMTHGNEKHSSTFLVAADISGKEDAANKSNDIVTDGSSTTKYPNVKAIKDYADGLVVGLLDDRGNYDASVNTFPAAGGSGTAGAILKGDLWYISVAGTLGGKAVVVGDTVRALIDTPGQTASNWDVLNVNSGIVPEDSAHREAASGYAGLDASSKVIKDPANANTTAGNGTIPKADSSGKIDSGYIKDNLKLVPLNFIIGNGASVPATGLKGYVRCHCSGTIQSVTLAADVSGSCVVDVKKSTFANFPTTASICASAKPTLATAQKMEDVTLTGWTKTITAGDMLEFNLDSVATCQLIMIEILILKD